MSEYTIVNGVKLYSEKDMVVRAFNEHGSFEPESFKVWKESCRYGGIAIDIGAYTGLYSIAARKEGSVVYSFEPNPAVICRLFENLMLNEVDVNHFPFCLSSDFRKVKFKLKESTTLTSAGKISDDGDIEVDTVRLDSIISKPCDVSVIKIDVEGHELEVLKGATTVLQRSHPVVIAESLVDSHGKELVDFMMSMGYNSCTRMDGRNLIFK